MKKIALVGISSTLVMWTFGMFSYQKLAAKVHFKSELLVSGDPQYGNASYISWVDILKVYDEGDLKYAAEKISADGKRANVRALPYGSNGHFIPSKEEIYYLYAGDHHLHPSKKILTEEDFWWWFIFTASGCFLLILSYDEVKKEERA